MIGRLAQLVRAPALHAGSRGFESLIAQFFEWVDPDLGRFTSCACRDHCLMPWWAAAFSGSPSCLLFWQRRPSRSWHKVSSIERLDLFHLRVWGRTESCG